MAEIDGTDNMDLIIGTAAEDEIAAKGGDDLIISGSGDDIIEAGTGDDLVFSGSGDDTVVAGDGNDVVFGGSGDDNVAGDSGDDIVSGGVGNDLLDGGSGNDVLAAGSGNDTVLGGSGSDVISGGSGEDNLSGNEGEDVIVGGDGDDIIDGGAGDDDLRGGAGSDTLLSGGAPLTAAGAFLGTGDLLDGGEGDDTLVSQGGFSIMTGGLGNDTIQVTDTGDFWDWANVDYSTSTSGIVANLSSSAGNGLGANEVSDGLGGTDTVTGIHVFRDSNFDDAIYADGTYTNSFGTFLEIRLSGGDDLVDFTGSGAFTRRVSWQNAADGVNASLVTGIAVDNNLANGDQIGTDTFINANYLRGSSHDDTLTGDDGDNRLRGSSGDDLIDGGLGADQIDHNDSSAGITVDLSLNQVIDDGLGGTDTLISIENVRGSSFADTITGDAGANVLLGQEGDDVLNGGDGNDSLVGDFGDQPTLLGGDDILNGGAGDDTLQGGVGNDTLNGGADNDFIDGGIGNDTLNGGAGTDFLDGGAGDDVLDGGADSDDNLLGGAGDDTFIFRPGYGNDIIIDFAAGAGTEDTVNLINTGIEDFATLLAKTADNGSGNATITLDSGERLSFIGVSTTQLHADDFTFLNNVATDGDDVLTGTASEDVIDGLGGDDIIDGGAGDDNLQGGAGNDTLLSGGAPLTAAAVFFGTGDLLDGGEGDDTLVSQGGFSIMTGGLGNDTIQVTDTGDFWDWANVDYSTSTSGIVANLSSSAGNGLGANEVSDGLGGTDTVTGVHVFRDSDFDDVFYADGTYINSFGTFLEIRLSGGDDLVDFTGSGSFTRRVSWQNAADGVNASLVTGIAVDNNLANGDQIGTDTFINANYLRGSSHDDTLTGDDSNNTLRGSGGDDLIDGGLGFDKIDHNDSSAGVTVDLSLNLVIDDGLGGTDTLISIEDVRGSSFADTITGDAGSNYLYGREGDDVIHGGDGEDLLVGDSGDQPDLLGGDDILNGGAGDDTLQGGVGNDTLNGGAGNDLLVGGADDDLFTFEDSSGTDTITDFNAGSAGGDQIDITDFGFADFNAVTTASTDVGTDVHIQLDADDLLILQNVSTAELASDDFLI